MHHGAADKVPGEYLMLCRGVIENVIDYQLSLCFTSTVSISESCLLASAMPHVITSMVSTVPLLQQTPAVIPGQIEPLADRVCCRHPTKPAQWYGTKHLTEQESWSSCPSPVVTNMTWDMPISILLLCIFWLKPQGRIPALVSQVMFVATGEGHEKWLSCYVRCCAERKAFLLVSKVLRVYC